MLILFHFAQNVFNKDLLETKKKSVCVETVIASGFGRTTNKLTLYHPINLVIRRLTSLLLGKQSSISWISGRVHPAFCTVNEFDTTHSMLHVTRYKILNLQNEISYLIDEGMSHREVDFSLSANLQTNSRSRFS